MTQSNRPLHKERVILVHGWMGLPRELFKLGRALTEAGYDVAHVRHYSMFGRFEAAVDATLQKLLSDPNRPAHLIGFSYGGLVVRAAADACPEHVSSLLLIGTPNAGSPLADALSLIYPTHSVRRLRRAAPRLPEPPAHIRVGCIAGTKGGLAGALLEGANDSRVSVTSVFDVRHEFEAVIPCKHEELRGHPEVLRQVVAFVQGEHAETFVAPQAGATHFTL